MLTSDRLRLFLAKDLRASWNVILIVSLLGLIVFTFASLGAQAYGDDMEKDDWETTIYPVHACILGTCAVAFPAAAYLAYYSEIDKRTLKTVALYDLDLNDITLTKGVTATAIGVLLTFIAVELTFAPWMLKAGGWAFFGLHVCLVVTCTMMALVMLASFYLTNALKALSPPLPFKPGFVHLTLLFFSFMMTEIFFIQMSSWRHINFDTEEPPLWAFPMYFSPVHASGRITGWLLGIGTLDASYVVFPVAAAAIIVVGYVLSRSVRSDIFIR